MRYIKTIIVNKYAIDIFHSEQDGINFDILKNGDGFNMDFSDLEEIYNILKNLKID